MTHKQDGTQTHRMPHRTDKQDDTQNKQDDTQTHRKTHKQDDTHTNRMTQTGL